MILSNIFFFLALAGAAYIVNKVAKFDDAASKFMANAFIGIVAVVWIVGLFSGK